MLKNGIWVLFSGKKVILVLKYMYYFNLKNISKKNLSIVSCVSFLPWYLFQTLALYSHFNFFITPFNLLFFLFLLLVSWSSWRCWRRETGCKSVEKEGSKTRIWITRPKINVRGTNGEKWRTWEEAKKV